MNVALLLRGVRSHSAPRLLLLWKGGAATVESLSRESTQATPVSSATAEVLAASSTGFDQVIDSNADQMLAQGRQIFRSLVDEPGSQRDHQVQPAGGYRKER